MGFLRVVMECAPFTANIHVLGLLVNRDLQWKGQLRHPAMTMGSTQAPIPSAPHSVTKGISGTGSVWPVQVNYGHSALKTFT